MSSGGCIKYKDHFPKSGIQVCISIISKLHLKHTFSTKLPLPSFRILQPDMFKVVLILTALYTVGYFNLQLCIIFFKIIMRSEKPVFRFLTIHFPDRFLNDYLA